MMMVQVPAGSKEMSVRLAHRHGVPFRQMLGRLDRSAFEGMPRVLDVFWRWYTTPGATQVRLPLRHRPRVAALLQISTSDSQDVDILSEAQLP